MIKDWTYRLPAAWKLCDDRIKTATGLWQNSWLTRLKALKWLLSMIKIASWFVSFDRIVLPLSKFFARIL